MKRLGPEPLSSTYGRERGRYVVCFFVLNDSVISARPGFDSGYKSILENVRVWNLIEE